jgi:hypothetical protein
MSSPPNLGVRASAVWEIRGRLWGGVIASSRFFAQFIHGPSGRAWRTVRDPFADYSADHLVRSGVFGWRRLLYCGPFAPCLPDSPPLLWRTVRSVRRFLPSLIGSFASSLVLPLVFQGIVLRTCSWSITMLAIGVGVWLWSCNWDIGRVFCVEFSLALPPCLVS